MMSSKSRHLLAIRFPGLVIERRVDGTDDVHQSRVVVATVRGGEVKEWDVAADRVEPVPEHKEDLVRSTIQPRLEEED